MAKMLPLYSSSSRAAIERRALAIFHASGRPLGRELDHWIQAESEFVRLVAERNEPRRRLRGGVHLVAANIQS